ADACRAQFSEHGWGGSWVDGVFGFHHFHSTSHEVLGVIRGQVTLELGGPQGREFEVSTGDVVVLPAGTGAPPGLLRPGVHGRRRLPGGSGGLRPLARG
ncbi:MAG: cupin domain-containing protein, partial [Actinomycetota bacterium]|nr:cupin domain-containing protein [Actinomycetota bacterium]